MKFFGGKPAILIFHRDRRGVIAKVAALIARSGLNVAHMEVSRHEKGGEALMIVEVDQAVTPALLGELASVQFVENVTGMAG